MTNDWQTVINLAMSATMIIFGIGAWSAQRKAREQVNATDIGRLSTSLDKVERDVSERVCWSDLDRVLATERRMNEHEIAGVRERIERLEKRVFNGGNRRGT